MRDKHGAISSHELKEQRKKERDEQQEKEKQKSGRSKLTRKILIVGGAFLLLSGVIYAFVIMSQGNGPRLADEDYILRTNLKSHNALSMHIHPHLRIVINGTDLAIPAEIGVTESSMMVVHTHDGTGTIHLESPVPKDFNVGHFFFVWSRNSGEQKIFNSTCILDYCADGNRTVRMLVNGQQNDEYEKFVMHDLDRIEIRFE